MTELKITVDQLKNYLATGLKCHSMGAFEEGTEYDEPPTPKEFVLTGVYIDANHETFAQLLDKEEDMHESFICDLFPHFYRISDLDKEIEYNGERFVPVEKLFPVDTEFEKDLGIKSMDYMHYLVIGGVNGISYDILQKLFEWHFWPFGEQYFEQGLVVDKMNQR